MFVFSIVPQGSPVFPASSPLSTTFLGELFKSCNSHYPYSNGSHFMFLSVDLIPSSACCTHTEHWQPSQMIPIQCQPTYFASKPSYHWTLSLFINITISLNGSKSSTLRLIIQKGIFSTYLPMDYLQSLIHQHNILPCFQPAKQSTLTLFQK